MVFTQFRKPVACSVLDPLPHEAKDRVTLNEYIKGNGFSLLIRRREAAAHPVEWDASSLPANAGVVIGPCKGCHSRGV